MRTLWEWLMRVWPGWYVLAAYVVMLAMLVLVSGCGSLPLTLEAVSLGAGMVEVAIEEGGS